VGEAEREFRKAIVLNPNNPLAHIWYANLLMSRNRLSEALAQVYIARGLDPFSLIVNSNVGWVLNVAKRTDEAVVHLKWTLELDSTYSQARWRHVGALWSAGRLTDARQPAERLVALTDTSSSSLALLADISFETGRENVTRSILARLLERARTEDVSLASIAGIFAVLRDTDNQLPWTEGHSRSVPMPWPAAGLIRARVRTIPAFVSSWHGLDRNSQAAHLLRLGAQPFERRLRMIGRGNNLQA